MADLVRVLRDHWVSVRARFAPPSTWLGYNASKDVAHGHAQSGSASVVGLAIASMTLALATAHRKIAVVIPELRRLR
jgi:hypothetical protein